MQPRFIRVVGSALRRWWWIGALLLFAACVAFKLNGSSVGAWQSVLAESPPIRGLLFSTPKTVRGDEWVVITPAMLSQARQTPPFPIENASLGFGRTPLLISVPVAYYTTLFRPQLWGFFLFDFERGFAFYWWCKVFGVLLASAWLLGRVGVRHRGIALFGGVWVLFSSFTQWWFSSPAMLPEMIACWAIAVGCSIALFRDAPRWQLYGACCGVVFFGINFILCLYPPFQVPLLLLAVVLVIAALFDTRAAAERLHLGRGFIFIGAALAATILLLVPFWLETRATLEVIAQTAYPGARRSSGGELGLLRLFSGLLGFFENESKFVPGAENVSEGSNFYLLWPLALLGVVACRVRLKMRAPALVIGLAAYIVALSVYCVVPLPAWLLNATLLAFSIEVRALLAIGLANVIVVCVFLDRYANTSLGKLWSLGGAVAAAVAVGALMFCINQVDAAFFADHTRLILLGALNAAVMLMFFVQPLRRWLPLAFSALLIVSNAGINPLMRGLAPLLESPAFAEVDRVRAADPSGKWIVYEDALLAQVVQATGAQVLNGTKIVPDLPLLRQLDPAGAYASVYNRYARVACALQVYPEEVSFSLVHDDFYVINLPPALPSLLEAGYRYLVFPGTWPDAIFYDFGLVAKTPDGRLSIYRRDTPAARSTSSSSGEG